MGINKREFDADFESVKNLQKNFCEKSYQWKSNRKIEFMTFITVSKRFRPMIFLHFFQRI
jgi:hypothetical protein